MSAVPRVVLDTNVCLDVLLFASERSAPLRALLDTRRLQAVTRADCRAEWHRVLRYPVLALDAARCAAMEVAYDAMLQHVASASDEADAEHVSPDAMAPAEPPRLPRCKDRDDQKFLELARDAGAVALFTRDAELLKLGRRTVRDGLFHILEPGQINRAALVRPQRVSRAP